MPFSLQKMTFDDECVVYSETNDEVMRRFGFRRPAVEDYELERWCVDTERKIYIFRMKRVDPRLPRVRYLMSVEGEPVVFELDQADAFDVVATLRFVPESLQGHEGELQALYQEGFAAGADEFVGWPSKYGPVNMSFAQAGGNL